MRIGDSSVIVTIQRSDERVLEQESKVVALNASLPAQSLVVEQARLDYFREDTVSLSSHSLRTDACGGDSEFARAVSSEQVVGAALEGLDAWQAIAVQSVSAAANATPVAGSSLLLQVEHMMTQQVQQSTLFTAQGHVVDENGASITFQLALALDAQRELKTQSEFTLVTPPRTDPVVINFAAASAQLTDLTFDFDLNADGGKETLARLGSGSGYLVFDKNANGVADNGNELFGVHSGDGFAELRQFDNDANLWLDENDAAFAQLSVWVRDDNGSNALFSLKELGVGAIYLGASADDFELTSTLGVPLGSIRAHSVVLMENGDVRTAQQLDLVNLSPAPPALGLQGAGAASMTVGPAPPLPTAAAVVTDTARLRLDAIDRLNSLRAQQAQYRDSLREQRDEPKSMLQQLLEKMDELRQRYREAQATREHIGRLYQRAD